MTEENFSTPLSKWIHDKGYGMTALELYQYLEKSGINGPAVHILRSQFLRTGTCSFDDVDFDELYRMNDAWDRRFSDGL